jgi:two-component system LytT family response regulator
MFTFKHHNSKKMLRAIIIDDEQPIRLTLEKVLEKTCPNVRIVDMADGVASGLKSIRKHHPDLVLLDIKMNDGTGFDLLDQAQPVDFRIIFITAYDQFAVEAFRYCALDYLLKPIMTSSLAEAIHRAEEQKIKDIELQLSSLKNHLKNPDQSGRKIILKTIDNIHILKVEDILYCEADSNYTTFYLENTTRIVVSKNLKEYEEMLRGAGFFRVHKSYLVNLSKVTRIEKGEGGYLHMENQAKIPVGASRKEQLMELFGRLME